MVWPQSAEGAHFIPAICPPPPGVGPPSAQATSAPAAIIITAASLTSTDFVFEPPLKKNPDP
ncbi:MAG: hypothetical protein BroJett003_18760 [Planctomycetota bacterium]|nr:MAG: hypothetical protein BroJett003_18760 [Planctomycetota bacterium]